MNKESLFWNKKNKILKKDKKIILINTINATWIKMTTECYEIFDKIIDAKISKKNFKKCFENPDDFIYMNTLLENMLNANIIVLDDNYAVENNPLESVSLVLTNRCNLNCVHCCKDAETTVGKDSLETNLIYKIIDKLEERKAKQILLTGGEPLIRKDFVDILDYINKNYSGNVGLITNGLLINESNLDAIVNTFDSISISIDGVDRELTRIIRVKDIFDDVINKVKLLQSKGYKKISLSAILPPSFEIENKFNELCVDLKVAPEIRTYSYNGRGGENADYIEEKFDEYINKNGFCKYIPVEHEAMAGLHSCAACTSTITISENGDLFPCNLLQFSKYCMGNVIEDIDAFDNITTCSNYDKFMKFKDLSTTKCADCDVNIFCWYCLSDTEYFQQNDSLEDNRCEIRREFINNELWGKQA